MRYSRFDLSKFKRTLGLLCLHIVLIYMLLCCGSHTNAGSAFSDLQTVTRAKLSFNINDKDITAYYTGAILNGRPYGEGIYEFIDTHGNWSYMGTLKDGAFYNGTMTDYPYTITFPDENSYSKYTGAFKEGSPSGQGTYKIITPNNIAVLVGIYDVETGFTGSAANLEISYVYNGLSFFGAYTGKYVNGQPEGNGTFKSDGKLFLNFDGEWSDGLIKGPGTLHTNYAQININGTLTTAEYNGAFSDGCFNGEGTITITRDDATYIYSGNWQDNIYSGYGKLSVTGTNILGYTYDGNWTDGLYDGEGSLIYDDKNIVKYIGNFNAGKFRPTFTQLITCLCSAENSEVILPDYCIEYIDVHEQHFIDHIIDEMDEPFSYAAYSSEPSEKNAICFTADVTVIQAREYDEDIFGYPVVEFIGVDENEKIYYGYYIGAFEDIKSGDKVEIVAYPLGYSSYKNQDDKDVFSLRFIAYQVSREVN